MRPPTAAAVVVATGLAAILAFSSCGPSEDPGEGDVAGGSSVPAAEGPPAVEMWEFSSDLIIEIGVVSGEEAHQLSDVRDAALLPDGGIVVANSGSSEVRVFDADGRFVVAQGGVGDGPGEWRGIAGVEVVTADSVAVVDGPGRRVGFVDPGTGEYLGDAPPDIAAAFRAPTLWFHDGLLVDAPVEPAWRGALLPVLDRLDITEPSAPIFVRLDEEGRVWVLGAPSAPTPQVRVFDLEGRLRARLLLPSGFQPFEITEDRMLGVGRGDLDVEYVRLYAIENRGGWSGPRLESADPSGVQELPPTPDPPEALREKIREPFRSMAASQEMYYAGNFTYTTDVGALGEVREMDIPPDVRVDLLFANPNGWAARFVDLPSGGGCLLSYGAGIQVEDMPPGMLNCWGGPERR